MGTTTATARTRPKPKRRSVGVSKDQAIALAQTITGPRPSFAEVFRDAQVGRADALKFEAVASGITDETSAYARAISRAAEEGWLPELCIACFKARLVDDGFAGAAAAATGDERLARLQQLTSANRGIGDAGLFNDRMPTAIRQVCQIEIDGQPEGTGFLIRSDLVMTGYHVVRGLLDNNDKALAASAGRLRARFDFRRALGADGNATLVDGTVCKVADPWLVAVSPCTAEEILGNLPAQESDLKGFWDFAVIRLAETPPGFARKGLTLEKAAPGLGHRLLILQHPKKRPLGWDRSTVRRFLGEGGFRIVHDVNTEDGSSGSPCLNDDFKVVGVHQGAMPPRRGHPENRAVPMKRILGSWDPEADAAGSAPFRPLLHVPTQARDRHPVFGRLKVQQWVTRASLPDNPATTKRDRFLVVTGPKGSGKTFTIDLLKALLPGSDHTLLEARASDFNGVTTALAFAEKYLLAPLGADAKGLPTLAQADTSDNAWLNYQLVGDLLNAMNTSRKGRVVWLVLDELDEVVLPDQGQVRKLLDLLYARAGTTAWLRFVLLGLEAMPVPSAIPFTERDFAGPVSPAALQADVADYFMRALEESRPGTDVAAFRPILGPLLDTIVTMCIQAKAGRVDHEDLIALVVDKIADFEQQHFASPGGP